MFLMGCKQPEIEAGLLALVDVIHMGNESGTTLLHSLGSGTISPVPCLC